MSRYAPQGSQARVNSRVFCSGGSLGAALAGPDSFSGPPALSNSPRPELSPAAVLESCRGSQSPALRARDKRRPHELQNRPRTIATMSIIWRTLTNGTSTSRSWFHAGLFGSGKWFLSDGRSNPPAADERSAMAVIGPQRSSQTKPSPRTRQRNEMASYESFLCLRRFGHQAGGNSRTASVSNLRSFLFGRGRAAPVPRSPRWGGSEHRRPDKVNYRFGLVRRGLLLSLPFKPTLTCGRRGLEESGGPPLFEPSLKVEGDSAHRDSLFE
jgi:hypothetical protein